MSIVKSLSVGNGDMFYIKHGSDNFTTIDCSLTNNNRESIIEELKRESRNKSISRFISTHPDEDHIQQLDYLDDEIEIANFYCVKNEATKSVETTGYIRYCELRDSSKAFNIYKDCRRKFMNLAGNDNNGNEIGSSGISILWPNVENKFYKDELEIAKSGGSPNNISPIIKYSVQDGVTFMWMGDLETTFMENIENELELSKVNILFAPHHGRHSGKIPKSMLDILNPDIIVIGEANSQHLNYYPGYNTLTQNTAGDITFEIDGKNIHIYASKESYSVNFLKNKYKSSFDFYIGTLET